MQMDLRLARKIARLKQDELARRAGIDPTLLSQLENGHRSIRRQRYEIVVRLARALNLEPDELVPDLPAPPAEKEQLTP